ncbi:MAG: isoprenylcysteine carboxylmethyltransferase family protein [Sphingomonadales bacterium]|nr:isoprenylcysteine carboxylmethyltransferase family protein [Sphingomonadales bacterium]
METGAIETRPQAPWLSARFLDRAEQVLVVIFWTMLALRVDHSDNPLAPLLLASESVIAIFVLIRRSTGNISMRLGDWLLAITGTVASLLIIPSANILPMLIVPAVLLALLGNIWQISAKLVLRRSFGIAPANRGVKVGGPYRFMRHPMYAGYLMTHIGILMVMTSWINFLIYAICWTAQIKRILVEEELLGQDPAYAAYMQQVRWRLIPGIF